MNDHSSEPPEERPSPSSAEQVIEGTGASPGVAIGTVFRFVEAGPEVERTHISEDEVSDELSLFDDALSRARQELAEVRSVAERTLGPDGEAILEAQTLMLDDEELRRAVRTRIREERESAAQALTSVLQRHRRRLEASDDAYLRERANDLDELEGRLLRTLHSGNRAAAIEPQSVVVADRLTAGDIIRFNETGMQGCVMARGGATSHGAIIARALNVPAVVGAEGVLEAVVGEGRAIVDGHRGRLILNPTPATLDRYRRRREEALESQGRFSNLSPETTDGHRITLQANIDLEEEIEQLDAYGASGIGLLRTELLLLGNDDQPLAEDTQFTVYRRAAEGTDGATIRLLDLGGDKLTPGLDRQENPFLGWRGVRVLLDRTDELMRPQVRALLRANAHGRLRVLLPMVTHLDEVRRVRAVVDEEADRLAADGVEHDRNLPLGVMVEVPAVALQAQAFAEEVDFLSIGTNDLTQFVLAIDRGNERVAHRFDALHPAVLNLVRRTAEAGQAADTSVTLCGEVAGEVCAVPILVGLGVRTLSLALPALLRIHRLVRQIDSGHAEALAQAALSAPDAASVRRQARNWLHDHVDPDVLDTQRGSGTGASS